MKSMLSVIIPEQMKCVCCAKDVSSEAYEPMSLETTL